MKQICNEKVYYLNVLKTMIKEHKHINNEKDVTKNSMNIY